MGIIGVVYSSNTRTVDQPIYITCLTRKRLLRACAERRVGGVVCFVSNNFIESLITQQDKQCRE